MWLVDPVALACGEVVYHGENVGLPSGSEAERQRRNQDLNVFSDIPCSMTQFFPSGFHLLAVPPSISSGWQSCLWVTFHILTMKRSEPSPDVRLAGALILNFSTLRNTRNKFLWYVSPWYLLQQSNDHVTYFLCTSLGKIL